MYMIVSKIEFVAMHTESHIQHGRLPKVAVVFMSDVLRIVTPQQSSSKEIHVFHAIR
eukprot:UN15167